jgi:hypothetical protein
MTYQGKVQDGVVVLDEPTSLANGTIVKVEPVPTPAENATGPTWGEVLKDVIGKAEGLPNDLAANHDHYLHGAPKK